MTIISKVVQWAVAPDAALGYLAAALLAFASAWAAIIRPRTSASPARRDAAQPATTTPRCPSPSLHEHPRRAQLLVRARGGESIYLAVAVARHHRPAAGGGDGHRRRDPARWRASRASGCGSPRW